MNLNYDVVIIGAGAAGIAAGIELQKANINFIILEARNRIGGRTYTDQEILQSTPIDLGASWIHSYGPNNVLYKYHRSLDVHNAEIEMGHVRLCLDYDGNTFTNENQRQARDIFEQIYDHLDTLNYRRNTNEDQSMEQAMQAIYEKLVTSDGTVKRLVDLYLAGEEQYDGSNLTDLSVKHWGVGSGCGGDRSVSIGYGNLIVKIANQHNLPIQLNTLVTKIDATDVERILLTTTVENSSTISCRRLIITIPLGCLKKETILFEPPLPDWKRNAINQMGMGLMNKLVLRFGHHFWDRDVRAIMHACNQQRGRFRMTLCLPPPANTLILFVTGSFARELENLNDEQILEEVMTFLRNIFPQKQIPRPINYKFTRWLQDPLACGSYSYFAVHASPHTIEQLAKATSNGRVHWAGEHANVNDGEPYWSYGCVHSAFQSGQNAAQAIREQLSSEKNLTQNVLQAQS